MYRETAEDMIRVPFVPNISSEPREFQKQDPTHEGQGKTNEKRKSLQIEQGILATRQVGLCICPPESLKFI